MEQFNKHLHPVLDKLLQDQRESLKKHLPEGITNAEILEINMGLAWHAMFTLCASHYVEMQELAKHMQSAIKAGIELRQSSTRKSL